MLLLTPGPVPVPDFIQQALMRPVIPHRGKIFEGIYSQLLERLQYLFQTTHPVCTMIGSGTLGVEAAMYSLLRPGEPVLVVNIGKFSERWADYARVLGLDTHEVRKSWGQTITPAELQAAAEAIPGLRGVVITHCETSTGVAVDLEEISYALRQVCPEVLIIVDAITTAGAIPLYADAWDLDCVVTASQKALMNPAGLVCFGVSPRGQEALRETHAADYRNLLNYLRQAAKGSYPYTPPVQLLYGVDEALAYIGRETLPVIWNRTHTAARFFRAGLETLGGKLFPESPSDSLTAFSLPGHNPDVVRKYMSEVHQVILSGGQGHLTSQIARVSHMGMADITAMKTALTALEAALQQN
ncbi:MAG: alanine--glyoxylate aminotransferase family protein [Bacteroidia bacterium]|nr:alanine--glyoxylate aminotransferase family protein [Bacteroidia bacterium]